MSNSRSSSRRSFAASIHLFTNAFGSNLSPVDEVNAPPWTTESIEDLPEFVLVLLVLSLSLRRRTTVSDASRSDSSNALGSERMYVLFTKVEVEVEAK